MKRFARYQFPLILYALLVFMISSLSQLPDTGLDIPYIDKAEHLIEYFIFLLLAIRAVSHLSSSDGRRWMYPLAIGVSLLFALSDEYHQSFVPGRTADGLDFLADAIGIFLAAALYGLLHKRRRAASY